MAIVDSLQHRSPHRDVPGFLPPDELLRRVSVRFPLAVIDRELGDRMVREHGDHLVELTSPTSIIVEEWRALVGRVAYVTVRSEEGGPQFSFFLMPNPSLIDIEYDPPEDRVGCRSLLEALAEVLEYDIVTEDLLD